MIVTCDLYRLWCRVGPVLNLLRPPLRGCYCKNFRNLIGMNHYIQWIKKKKFPLSRDLLLVRQMLEFLQLYSLLLKCKVSCNQLLAWLIAYSLSFWHLSLSWIYLQQAFWILILNLKRSQKNQRHLYLLTASEQPLKFQSLHQVLCQKVRLYSYPHSLHSICHQQWCMVVIPQKLKIWLLKSQLFKSLI